MAAYTAPAALLVFKSNLILKAMRDESTNEKRNILVTTRKHVVKVPSGSRAQAKVCIRKT